MDQNSNAPILTNQIETAEGTLGVISQIIDDNTIQVVLNLDELPVLVTADQNIIKTNILKDQPNYDKSIILTDTSSYAIDPGVSKLNSFIDLELDYRAAPMFERCLEIKFIKTHPDAMLPVRAHETNDSSDTGYDVFAVEDVTIPGTTCYSSMPGIESGAKVGSAIVPIGIKVGYITPGYWFRIEGKSGLGFKQGLQPHFGIIDNSYRGDCGIKIYNLTDKPYTYKKGDKVAQLVFYPLIHAHVEWTDIVNETKRGEGGFGHTGK